MSTGKVKLPVLENLESYTTWAKVLKVHIKTMKAWDLIEPVTPAVERTEADLDLLESKVLSVLLGTVKGKILDLIALCDTAKDVWEQLKEIGELQSDIEVSNVECQLEKLKPEKDVRVSLQEVKTLFGKLKLHGGILSENQKCHHLFKVLPKKYDDFVDTLRTDDRFKTRGGQLSYTKIVKAVTIRINLVENRNPVASTEVKVEDDFVKKEHVFGADASKIKCFNCGELGHFKNKCKKCWHCKKEGHQRKDCPQRSNKQANVARASSSPADQSPEFGHEGQGKHSVFVTKVNKGKMNNAVRFCLDTGASAHVCTDKGLFTELHQVEEMICIATLHDFVYTNLVGTIKCTLGGLPVILKDVLYTDTKEGINVFSVGKLIDKGWKVSLGKKKAVVYNYNNSKRMTASRENGDLYWLEADFNNGDMWQFCNFNKVYETERSVLAKKWHYRLGHCDPAVVSKMAKEHTVEGLPKWLSKGVGFCDGCAKLT